MANVRELFKNKEIYSISFKEAEGIHDFCI